MTRRATIIGFVLLALVVTGLVLTYIPKVRLRANAEASRNNLRVLGQFAAHNADPNLKGKEGKYPTQIPPGTIYLADVAPENRLSWAVPLLPLMDQKKNPVVELFPRIDQLQPWTAPRNQEAARTRLPGLLCPENPPDPRPDGFGVTSYVGIGGVGLDAAALPLGSPKSGAFRYDGPTPFERITDGLSQTLLFAETRNEVGPWLRGGPSTVRGLNDAPDALPLVGGQLGGYFPAGVHVAMCDGSGRLFSPRTTPRVLIGLATISGKDTDPLPGE
jgi:hypothetical protein